MTTKLFTASPSCYAYLSLLRSWLSPLLSCSILPQEERQTGTKEKICDAIYPPENTFDILIDISLRVVDHSLIEGIRQPGKETMVKDLATRGTRSDRLSRSATIIEMQSRNLFLLYSCFDPYMEHGRRENLPCR
ncbi:hypothetical protein IW261DRAFT_172515 [Armillaria novae-zelandiae]|uniref:Uncharacterized protein n=1 Tax=Armillaria novae-zelandiae TaxID=153914 RepID=A0AA39T3X6_9AGAR|nr:hypothetical protein IW261DRAFT_172515 [Armillaria novae-zelandiae]